MSPTGPERRYIELQSGEYLSSVIQSLPPGKFQKKVPGIGATTMEILDTTRNSIIVFPTRALAASKVLKHKFHYVGGSFNGIKASKADLILKELQEGKLVKVAVVADSLMKLVDALGEPAFRDFHLMLDEIDAFQSESNYRPKLQQSIDVYFRFPEDRRTMVSATIQPFEMPELKAEPTTEVKVIGYQKPKLLAVNYHKGIESIIAEYTRQMYRAESDTKILVALNSIQAIKKVVALIEAEFPGQIGVLCSERSYHNFPSEMIDYLVDGQLKYPISFVTSAYFLGVDIHGKLRVIIAADVKYPTSLLSSAKLWQIFGRARDGCVERLFFYNVRKTWDKPEWEYPNQLRRQLQFALNLFGQLDSEDARLLPVHWVENMKRMIVNASVEQGIPLLEYRDNKLKVNYFNIDYLIMQNQAKVRFYSRGFKTPRFLALDFEVEDLSIVAENIPDDHEILDKLDQEAFDQLKRRSLTLLNLSDEPIEEIVPVTKFEKILEALIILVRGSAFLSQGKIFGYAEEIIKGGMNVRKLNNLLWRVKIYSLGPGSELWKLIPVYFQTGQTYSKEQIRDGIQKIAAAFGSPELFPAKYTTTTCGHWISLVFKKYRSKNNPNRISMDTITDVFWEELVDDPQSIFPNK